jgi:hypothetical protein
LRLVTLGGTPEEVLVEHIHCVPLILRRTEDVGHQLLQAQALHRLEILLERSTAQRILVQRGDELLGGNAIDRVGETPSNAAFLDKIALVVK